jgi:acetyl-CoA C-acetyltransferase
MRVVSPRASALSSIRAVNYTSIQRECLVDMMKKSVIASPLRTAIAKEAGGLRNLGADEIGANVIRAVVSRGSVKPTDVEDVIMGNSFSTSRIGRHCALLAGLPVSVPGVGINRLCGSGLEALIYASLRVETNNADLILAGGTESYTRAPYLMEKPTEAYQRRAPKFVNPETRGDLGPPELGLATSMGLTGENVAQQYRISRKEQDDWALESNQRSISAMKNGVFKDQIVPIEIVEGGKKIEFVMDECPRSDTSIEKLSALPPLFEEHGTVTAGNCSKRSDAAAAMIVTNEEIARKNGFDVFGRITASAVVGVHPNIMGMGPVEAVPIALKKAGLSIKDIGVVELNEAFASQVLAVIKKLYLDPSVVNPHGGAIAHGHPSGATGAVLATKLLHRMRQEKIPFGMVTMCIGSGMGIAAVFERIE